MNDLPTHKATNLRDALNQLDPERPLTSPRELEAFFVARPESPIDDLRILLEATHAPQKILFTGHRGSGKSTELAKLKNELGDALIVIRYSAKRIINPLDLSYVDVLLSIGLVLFERATQLDVALNPEVVEHVLHFTREITREVIDQEATTQEASGTLSVLVGKLSGKLSTEDTTRTTVRETVKTRISDLLESIELLAREMEIKTGKRVLVIVEDLDKADLGTAKTLFYEHARPLLEPEVSVIYTFPTALRHDNAFMQIQMNFPEVEVLPNIKTEQRDGAPYEAGIDMMRDILLRRVEETLFTADALTELAELSSGIPRELIALGRQAALEALKDGQDAIDADAVQRAAQRKRRDYDVLLSREQRRLLAEVHADKDVDNTEAYRALLHNLSVLEYRNADVWYDVHPLARHLIDEGGA